MPENPPKNDLIILANPMLNQLRAETQADYSMFMVHLIYIVISGID